MLTNAYPRPSTDKRDKAAFPDEIIQMVSPLEDDGWDNRLPVSSEPASFFHGTAWARVLQRTYGYRPVYFIARAGERLRCVLPLMEVASWLTGRRGIGLPFTDNCAPLGMDDHGLHRAFRAARDYGEQRGWRYLECRGGREKLFDQESSSTVFYGHRLALGHDVDALFGQCDSATRRAVRKAQKEGVKVEFAASWEAMRAFYGLLCRTRRRHGLPPQPLRFFRNLHECVLAQGQGMIALARYRDVITAGAVFVHFGDRAIFKYGASDHRFQQIRSNNLVMWESIRSLAQRGFAELQFGRTSLANEGLRRFKRGWGAVEEPIEYARYDLAQNRVVSVPDRSAGWYNRMFRLLPVPVARLAGKALYKHVA